MDEDVRLTIRVFKLGVQPKFHWVVIRITESSKYQKDGDERSQSMALAAAVAEISQFEKLDETCIET